MAFKWFFFENLNDLLKTAKFLYLIPIFQDINLPSVTPLGGVIEEDVTSKAKFDFPKSKTTSPYITTFILELLTF